MKNLAQRKTRDGERGSILAISAVAMLTVLLAVGLGVDISHFYLAKTELQNAADAAALAGVSGLNGSTQGIIDATDYAVKVMNNFNFNHDAINFPRGNVLFAQNLDGPYVPEASAKANPKYVRFVRVTTPPSAVAVSFAASVLGSSKDLTATATAGLSVPLNVICNWLPVSVIDYDVPISPGQTYTFRAAPGSMVSPGDYQILAAAGAGGKDVRIGLASGVDLCASPGSVYSVDTKPGQTAGAVRQGINTRFDEYTTSQVNPDDQPPDKNIKEHIVHSDYLAHTPTQPPSHPGVDGRREVIIPIVKFAEYDPGRGEVKFDRFGLFFLQTKVGSGNGGDLVAEYIDDFVVAGKGGYDPNAGPANNLLATPVLYK